MCTGRVQGETAKFAAWIVSKHAFGARCQEEGLSRVQQCSSADCLNFAPLNALPLQCWKIFSQCSQFVMFYSEARRDRPYTHQNTRARVAWVCHQHLPSDRHASVHPPLCVRQPFSVRIILSVSGHIAPLCHSNYSHKAQSCKSINARTEIRLALK